MPKANEVVKMSVGLTLNLGNYQSLRVDVGLERTVESGLETAFKSVREDLHEQLDKCVTEFLDHAQEIENDQKRRK